MPNPAVASAALEPSRSAALIGRVAFYKVDTASDGLAAAVRTQLPFLEKDLARLSRGKVALDDDYLAAVLRKLAGDAHTHKGVGYWASSLGADPAKELLISALAVRCLKEANLEPLVIPLDDFLVYPPQTESSFVARSANFDEDTNRHSSSTQFALVISGFCSSTLLPDDLLRLIPSQEEAGLWREVSECGGLLGLFAQNLWRFENRAGPRAGLKCVQEIVQNESGVTSADVKLLYATALLLQDRNTWQRLWYERSKKGTPLMIVAPSSFHQAMNRLNRDWGKGGPDYQYRCCCSLGALDMPVFEELGREILTGGQLTGLWTAHDPRVVQNGLSRQQFEIRVMPILRKLERLGLFRELSFEELAARFRRNASA